jgi:hypothetical protein
MTDAHAAAAEFLEDFWGTGGPLSEDADILDTLGIDGDDAFNFIEGFAAKFEIDISNYHWYFHHGEEVSLNIGSLFFKPLRWPPFVRLPGGACSSFTRVTVRRIAQPPKGDFCREAPAQPVAQPSRSPASGLNRQLPGWTLLHR